MRKAILLLGTALMSAMLMAADDPKVEEQAVMKAVEDAYVNGLWKTGDTEAMRKGFHQSFVMFVQRDGEVSKVTRDDWIARIEKRNSEEPNRKRPRIAHRFPMVEVTGNAAVIKVEIEREGKHIYTDFMSLYKFDDGWKIVGKTYHSHN